MNRLAICVTSGALLLAAPFAVLTACGDGGEAGTSGTGGSVATELVAARAEVAESATLSALNHLFRTRHGTIDRSRRVTLATPRPLLKMAEMSANAPPPPDPASAPEAAL